MYGRKRICTVCHLNDTHAQNTADVCFTPNSGERIPAFSDDDDEAGSKGKQRCIHLNSYKGSE